MSVNGSVKEVSFRFKEYFKFCDAKILCCLQRRDGEGPWRSDKRIDAAPSSPYVIA